MNCQISAGFLSFSRIGKTRLVGGSAHNEGRLEVLVGDEVGTVCDDGWGMEEAEVACRQLGFPGAIRATSGGWFGSGTGPILLDDVVCTGHEAQLTSCRYTDGSRHNCNHNEDAGVVCQNNSTLCSLSSFSFNAMAAW